MAAPETFVEAGDPVPDVYCYGGDGGDVFTSPLPVVMVILPEQPGSNHPVFFLGIFPVKKVTETFPEPGARA